MIKIRGPRLQIVVLFLAVALALSMAGCGRGFAKVKRQASELDLHTITVNGEERTYFIYVPRSYRGRPVPLVVYFHGGGGSGDGEAKAGRWPEMAERGDFIAVFPNGTSRFSNEGGTWNAGSDQPSGYAEEHNVDDIAFVRALLQAVEQSYAIDRHRIYASGMSKGAIFTYHVACAMPEVFAAIAPVAGTLTNSSCNLSQPVALLHIHGTDDQNVPFEGGRGSYTRSGAEYPPAMRGIEFWRAENRCNTKPEQVSKGEDTSCWRFSGCSSGATVGYCLVEGGGHAWPGQKPMRWQKLLGVKVTQNFDATSAIWDFFSQHPK